jgi:DNA-directed RNA polymerase I subunit RPA1
MRLSHAYTFRKEKSIKIIEYDLSPKHKLANATIGVRRPAVIGNGKAKKSRKSMNPDEIDEGYEAGSASDGSEAMEDNAMEVDESVQEESEEGDDVEDQDEGVVNEGPARAANGKVKGARGRQERVVAVSEVKAHLELLFARETEVCGLLYGRHGGPSSTAVATPALAAMFFMDVVPVPPTRFRPAARMGDDLFENAQNSLLSAVISTCERIHLLNQRMKDYAMAERGEMVLDAIGKAEGARAFELLLEALVKLQNDVNSFMDSTKNPTIMRQGKLPPQGVKQVLEKKEGLFRKHMMVGHFYAQAHVS